VSFYPVIAGYEFEMILRLAGRVSVTVKPAPGAVVTVKCPTLG
jgi:hypothetical protein